MTARPSLAVSILNWNGLDLTKQCLGSLLASTVQPDTIIVLDNGSNQNEAASLQKDFTRPVTVLRSETNLGFAGGNNFVIKHLRALAAYDYIVLLNQDALVEPDCLEKIVNYLETQPTVAVAGPLVLNTDDTIQSCGANINPWSGKIISRLQGLPRSAAPAEPVLVDCVIGNCFMLRSSALATIGLLDEKYFAYYEEADWCLRARRANYKCAVLPSAVIRHAKTGGFRTYLITRNLIWFQKRYAKPLQLFYFWWYFWLYFVVERLKKGAALADLLRAAYDGWFNRNSGQP